MRVDLYRGVPAGSAGGGGGAAQGHPEGTSPQGGSVGFSAELYLGPANGYSYSSGGAGYLQGYPFASKLTRIIFRTVAAIVDLTARLRTSAGTVLWTGTLVAGQTKIDETVNVSLAADVRVQFSVEPASGGPSIDAWSFGWVRELT